MSVRHVQWLLPQLHVTDADSEAAADVGDDNDE